MGIDINNKLVAIMKVFRVFAMLLLGLSIAFTSCEKEPKSVPVTGITLNSESLTMTEGETARLTATISPSNADNQGVIWSSSNASVASVSNGTVTAVSAGSATITAKSDDGGKTATCNVTVSSKIVAVTGVSLDKTSLELTEGDEYSLVATVQPMNASNKQVSWKSDDETVATISDGKVKAIKPGSTTITVTTSDGNKSATCYITVKDKTQMTEYVDLGLSVKWATCNLGASSPEEYGDYYAWGETETKTNYSEDNYKFYKSETVSEGGIDIEYKGTKYIPQSKADSYGFNGFYDDKTVLDPDDDVAHVKLGGKWRMPTKAEYDELINNCQCDWVTYKGVNGRKLTSKKSGYTDKWIFLPAAGFRDDDGLNDAGSFGYYWSSSLHTFYSYLAWYLDFTSLNVGRSSSNYRCDGLSVRPVSE